jgi:hypothetical protein
LLCSGSTVHHQTRSYSALEAYLERKKTKIEILSPTLCRFKNGVIGKLIINPEVGQSEGSTFPILKSITGHNPEPIFPIRHPHNLRFILMLFSHLFLGLTIGRFSKG